MCYQYCTETAHLVAQKYSGKLGEVNFEPPSLLHRRGDQITPAFDQNHSKPFSVNSQPQTRNIGKLKSSFPPHVGFQQFCGINVITLYGRTCGKFTGELFTQSGEGMKGRERLSRHEAGISFCVCEHEWVTDFTPRPIYSGFEA